MVRLMTRTLEPAHCHSHCALGPAHLYFGIRNLCRALAARSRHIMGGGRNDWGLKLDHLPVISIVDDDEPVREATKSLVRSLGYKVETFRSAAEFLESAQVEDTDCLVTDVRMPGLSGVELQNRLTNRTAGSSERGNCLFAQTLQRR